ncbi:MAG TPA: peptide MFS transporter [Steroidobacteraceae bacterium]|nr:peptide MFS transporter [Steroidobacteraceae bacterium]
MTSATGQPAAIRDRTWFGHPRGLTILFLTEMWSEFSFFGMRTLLVYYMTQQLLISQAHSSLIYGLYLALAYFTPIPGGIASDRWLGRRRAVLLGGGIMAAGHFMMAFESTFYPALATIAIGNGLLLPSLTSQINELYRDEDPRKSVAYNIYYVGVNVGGMAAPFVCGTIGELWGWNWGFTVAGLGMVAGLVVYLMGTPLLPREQGSPRARPPAEMSDGRSQRLDGGTILLLAAVLVLVVVYRSAYEQVGNTVALWAETGVDRSVGSWTIPMTWFQALNPLGIFLFTPIVLAVWRWRAARGKSRSAVAKMATGALVLCASFLLLAGAALHAGASGTRASWIWLASYFFLFTAGELFILPVGLGLFGRVAPPRIAATMIAAWFAAAFFGNLGAGMLGTLWSAMPPYDFFAVAAGVAASAGVLLLALAPWARKFDPDSGAARVSARPSPPTVPLPDA